MWFASVLHIMQLNLQNIFGRDSRPQASNPASTGPETEVAIVDEAIASAYAAYEHASALVYPDESKAMLRDFPACRLAWEILGKPRVRRRIDNVGYEAIVLLLPEMVEKFNANGLTTERNSQADRPDAKFNSTHLKKMEKILVMDDFVQGHPTICFSETRGNILDFNHGSQAVLNKQIPVCIVARFGCPDMVERAAGTCVPWSVSDFSHRNRFDANIAIAHFRIHFNRAATPEDVQTWVDANTEHLVLLRSKFPRSTRMLIKPVWKSAGLGLAFVEALQRVKNHPNEYPCGLDEMLNTIQNGGVGDSAWGQYFCSKLGDIVSDDKECVYGRCVSLLKLVIKGEPLNKTKPQSPRQSATWGDQFGDRQVLDTASKSTKLDDVRLATGDRAKMTRIYADRLGVSTAEPFVIRTLAALGMIYGDDLMSVVESMDRSKSPIMKRAMVEARRCGKALCPISEKALTAFHIVYGDNELLPYFTSYSGLVRLKCAWDRVSSSPERTGLNRRDDNGIPKFDLDWLNSQFDAYRENVTSQPAKTTKP